MTTLPNTANNSLSVTDDLAAQASLAAHAAATQIGLDPKAADVRRSDRPDLAPFQISGVLGAAKAAGRPPRELSAALAKELAGSPLFASIDVAGPGFINLALTDAALAARGEAIAASMRAGAPSVLTPRRVIVDFGGPNVAKGMHVGHLRASIIGESLKRLFRFCGDQVWGDAHFGDWGFQMGLMIVALEDDLGGLGDQDRLAAKLEALTLDYLEAAYPASAARARDDAAFRERARKATAALQAGREPHRTIWKAMHAVSMAAQKRDFAAINVDFDLWRGESDADPLIPAMIEELASKDLLVDDQGARIVRVARDGDKRELPPLLVVSSEGSAMYGTTDLATILQRREELAPELFLYVVDQRQADHFEQVFRAAALAGYAPREALEHIGFGTMNGTDGKPFKTRAGGVLKLSDLIGEAEERARARLREADIAQDLSGGEFEAVAHQVAIAAIKFADLVNFRGTSYVFDLDRFVSFEGKTGPYLLYQAVRIKSILRKAAEGGVTEGAIVLSQEAERNLILALDGFGAALRSAYDKRAPHFIAEHAFALAQSFSAFYGACPILQEADSRLRGSRLRLAGACLRQLLCTLDLLGIDAPERM